jgi:hypothetical protein
MGDATFCAGGQTRLIQFHALGVSPQEGLKTTVSGTGSQAVECPHTRDLGAPTAGVSTFSQYRPLPLSELGYAAVLKNDHASAPTRARAVTSRHQPTKGQAALVER